MASEEKSSDRPLDAFHAHEALHTAHVLMDCYGDHVADHPYVQANPELAGLAERAIEAMMDVYQAIGAAAQTDREEP